MDVFNDFVHWAHSQLTPDSPGSQYLLSRGSSSNQWDKHLVGFVPDLYSPDVQLDPNHSDDCERSNDRKCDVCRYIEWSSSKSSDGTLIIGSNIKNSIVYPLTSYSGSIVGFQVRSLLEKRYDTFVRTKRCESYFFGLSHNIQKIWTREVCCLVEGPSDLLTLERFIDIPVLSLTTNSTNEGQARFLKRFCKKIYLCLDNDKAGHDGSMSIINKLSDSIDVVVVDYKMSGRKFKDLNEMWVGLGDKVMEKHVKSAFLHM